MVWGSCESVGERKRDALAAEAAQGFAGGVGGEDGGLGKAAGEKGLIAVDRVVLEIGADDGSGKEAAERAAEPAAVEGEVAFAPDDEVDVAGGEGKAVKQGGEKGFPGVLEDGDGRELPRRRSCRQSRMPEGMGSVDSRSSRASARASQTWCLPAEEAIEVEGADTEAGADQGQAAAVAGGGEAEDVVGGTVSLRLVEMAPGVAEGAVPGKCEYAAEERKGAGAFMRGAGFRWQAAFSRSRDSRVPGVTRRELVVSGTHGVQSCHR